MKGNSVNICDFSEVHNFCYRRPLCVLAAGAKNLATSLYAGTLFYLTTAASHFPSAGLSYDPVTCDK